MDKKNKKSTGKKITLQEARDLAFKTLENAEKQRAEEREREAKQYNLQPDEKDVRGFFIDKTLSKVPWFWENWKIGQFSGYLVTDKKVYALGGFASNQSFEEFDLNILEKIHMPILCHIAYDGKPFDKERQGKFLPQNLEI